MTQTPSHNVRVLSIRVFYYLIRQRIGPREIPVGIVCAVDHRHARRAAYAGQWEHVVSDWVFFPPAAFAVSIAESRAGVREWEWVQECDRRRRAGDEEPRITLLQETACGILQRRQRCQDPRRPATPPWMLHDRPRPRPWR